MDAGTGFWTASAAAGKPCAGFERHYRLCLGSLDTGACCGSETGRASPLSPGAGPGLHAACACRPCDNATGAGQPHQPDQPAVVCGDGSAAAAAAGNACGTIAGVRARRVYAHYYGLQRWNGCNAGTAAASAAGSAAVSRLCDASHAPAGHAEICRAGCSAFTADAYARANGACCATAGDAAVSGS